MKKLLIILPMMILMLLSNKSSACSLYKITCYGKTVTGSNHDTWRETPAIWFEKGKYGACFSGSKVEGPGNYSPQSGMNEAGLTFSRLAAATPLQKSNPGNRKKIENPALYLKQILHNCQNIEEVKQYIEQYDHSYFIEDVFIYIDKTGKYLVVEPYKLLEGTDSTYVLANFCPSEISDFSKITQPRYRSGVAFIANRLDTTIQYFTALSDTMHVCRPKLGDGTLITSIWDSESGLVHLYFYHDYANRITFNLKDELKKSNHLYSVIDLFPANAEFNRLKEFQTALNNNYINLFLIASLIISSITTLVFGFRLFKIHRTIYMTVILCALATAWLSFKLATDISLYFLPSTLLNNIFRKESIAQILPFLLAASILPLWKLSFKLHAQKSEGKTVRWILSVFTTLLCVHIVLYSYWGLFLL